MRPGNVGSERSVDGWGIPSQVSNRDFYGDGVNPREGKDYSHGVRFKFFFV